MKVIFDEFFDEEVTISSNFHETVLNRWTSPPLDTKFRWNPLSPQISLFFPLLGVFSLNFGGVFNGRDSEMCTFGSGWGRWDFTRQPENSKRAHFRALALRHQNGRTPKR